MIKDCTALILAGGDSSRMGQDKAALVLEGKTLLESVTTTMQSIFPKVIVSVRHMQPRTFLPHADDHLGKDGLHRRRDTFQQRLPFQNQCGLVLPHAA